MPSIDSCIRKACWWVRGWAMTRVIYIGYGCLDTESSSALVHTLYALASCDLFKSLLLAVCWG
jgi:hypothetical protein